MKVISQNKLIKLQGNKKAKRKSINFVNFILNTKYVYHFKWLGVPTIQFPQDLICLQEIIYSTKPNVIIETGVAHGGTLLFYSSILKLLDIKNFKVFGIDILIKKRNENNIKKNYLSKNIELITGSSVSKEVHKILDYKINDDDKVMVVLDSDHNADHVYNELKLFKRFIKKAFYIVVLDTTIEFIDKKHINKGRSFSIGNSPYTGVKKFLKENKDFKIDKYFENKAMITSAYSGFLKKIK